MSKTPKTASFSNFATFRADRAKEPQSKRDSITYEEVETHAQNHRNSLDTHRYEGGVHDGNLLEYIDICHDSHLKALESVFSKPKYHGHHVEHEESSTARAGEEEPIDAIVTNSNSSYPPPIPVPEASLIVDALHVAVEDFGTPSTNNSARDANEVSYRLKKGQCSNCGMQTHKLVGVLMKSRRPLSNEFVLNGRCLICNPIDMLVQESGKTAAIDFPRPPPTAPPLSSSDSSNTEEKQPQIQHGLQRSESHEEVEGWLLSHIPILQMQDVQKYCECFIREGFESIAWMEHLEEGDLAFMKKAHRRALVKKLQFGS